MKKFLLTLVFAFTASALFASDSHHLNINWGQLFLNIMTGVWWVLVIALFSLGFFKINAAILLLDEKGAEMVTPEKSRELEEEYRQKIASKKKKTGTASEIQSENTSLNKEISSTEKTYVHADSYL